MKRKSNQPYPMRLRIFALLICTLAMTYIANAEEPPLYLFDAETDQEVDNFGFGHSIFNLATLPSQLTIVYEPQVQLSDPIGSVVFILNGKKVRPENVAPYALGGDTNGDFSAYPLPVGNYTLQLIVYELPRGKGNVLYTDTRTFLMMDIQPVDIFFNPQPLEITVPSGEELMANFEISHSPSEYTFGADLSPHSDNRDLEWVSLPSGLQVGQNTLVADARHLVPGTYEKTIHITVFTINYPYGTLYEEGSFTVIMQVTASDHLLAGSGTVVNADTDEDVITSTSGVSYNYFNFPTPRMFNVRINTNPEEVGSVVFEYSYETYDGKKTPTRRRIENIYPYAVFGDTNGDYHGEPFVGGTYFIKATPYSKPRGKGKAGTPIEFFIRVSGDPNARFANNMAVSKPHSVENFTFEENINQWEEASFTAFPNPFSDQLNIHYVAKSTGIFSLDIYTLQGVLVERLYEGKVEASQQLSFDLSGEGMQPGIYICHAQNGNEVQTHRIVLNK